MIEEAWSAGFFDGEGNIRFDGRRLVIQIGQVDRRALDRFSSVIGGRVNGPYANGGGQPIYRLQMYSKVKDALHIMWPHLGEVKKEQALKACLELSLFREARMHG